MTDPKCAQLLLRAAERDILTLWSMTAEAPEQSVGFHVQQAAKKAFKAWFALLRETHPLTHNFKTLPDFLADRCVIVTPFIKLSDCTPSAVKSRYEGVDTSTEPIEREGALALVEALSEQVRRMLANAEGT